MSKPASRLGRGLSTLIPSRETQPTPAISQHRSVSAAGVHADQIRALSVDLVTPNPRQPRTSFPDETLQELAESIRQNGLLQPVLVRAMPEGRYELVAGERRWRAAKLAGLHVIPAIVRELSDVQSFELALVENLQREDLGPLERAAAYQHYLDAFGGPIEDLARRLAQSRANISNYIRLLKLRPEICYMLGAGELGMGQARAIAAVADPQRQFALAKLAARRNLSVRQVEELVRKAEMASVPSENTDGHETPIDGRRQHIAEVEAGMSKAIGLRVYLRAGRKKNSGKVIIVYNDLDEFDLIAERLGAAAHLE